MRNATIAEYTNKSEATTSAHLRRLVEAGKVLRFDYFYVHREDFEDWELWQVNRLKNRLCEKRKECELLEKRYRKELEARKEFLRNGGREALSEQQTDKEIKEVGELERTASFYQERKNRLRESIKALFLYAEKSQSSKSKESCSEIPHNSINAEPIAV